MLLMIFETLNGKERLLRKNTGLKNRNGRYRAWTYMLDWQSRSFFRSQVSNLCVCVRLRVTHFEYGIFGVRRFASTS